MFFLILIIISEHDQLKKKLILLLIKLEPNHNAWPGQLYLKRSLEIQEEIFARFFNRKKKSHVRLQGVDRKNKTNEQTYKDVAI